MNTLKHIDLTNSGTGAVGPIERVLRTVISFAGFIAILTVATSPIQYFVLAMLGVYLMHTAIMGLDPIYAIAHYVRDALNHKGHNFPVHARGAH